MHFYIDYFGHFKTDQNSVVYRTIHIYHKFSLKKYFIYLLEETPGNVFFEDCIANYDSRFNILLSNNRKLMTVIKIIQNVYKIFG